MSSADVRGALPARARSPEADEREAGGFGPVDGTGVQPTGAPRTPGALLVLRLADLTILQASENIASHLGLPPEHLLGEPVARVVGSAQAAKLRQLLEQGPVEGNALFAFTLPARNAAVALDVCVHTVDGVVVLEFEATAGTARGDELDLLTLVTRAVARLQAAPSLREFCQRVTQEVRQLTGLDRVMVYRVHSDSHGEVVAESRRNDLPAWLGLHYPQGEVPSPAREVFERLGVWPPAGAGGAAVAMVPPANPDNGRALNMSHCTSRGASLMYTEYLGKLGVAATLTLPILQRGQLWGSIACHHETPIRFAHPVRAACELLAQVASLQLEAAAHGEALTYRLQLEGVHQHFVAKAASAGALAALAEREPSLLEAMQAGGTALFHLDRWWCAGRTPGLAQLDALADWLLQREELASATRPVFATDALARQYPAAAAYADVASGVLAVCVSRQRRELLLWFRPETIPSPPRAGGAHATPAAPATPGPRPVAHRPFDLFVESVHQCALPWLTVELDAALRVRLQVMAQGSSRAGGPAGLDLDPSRGGEELDALAPVAAHRLKEPLRSIHRDARLLLQSAQALEPENRQRVEGLTRLAVRIDKLLDSLQHYSRAGRGTPALEAVGLDQIVDDALETIGLQRGERPCTVERPRALPSVACDAARVREIYNHLLGNALKYNLRDCPRIEIGYLAPHEDDASGARARSPAAAVGQNIYYVRDDGIGIEPRDFEPIFRMFKRLHGHDEFGGGLGAGLTIVEKMVQRHGGQVWLDSTPGIGSSFYFTLAPPAECRP